MLSDQSLVEKVLKGDKQAFGIIIKNTEALTAQIVFKMIDNPEDRKDIAQDIYLKAFDKLAGFKFQSKLSTWIAQIAYNTCLNYLQKKKLVFPDNIHTENQTDFDALENLGSRWNDFSVNTTEIRIAEKERAEALHYAMEELPPVYKTLIGLFHREELSYEEISRITGLPEGTVKSYLFRARKFLKENIFSKYEKEEL